MDTVKIKSLKYGDITNYEWDTTLLERSEKISTSTQNTFNNADNCMWRLK